MKRVLVSVLAVWAVVAPASAQHPFYTQLLEQGDAAMARKDWPLAHRYLEIAAFGMLENQEQLAGAFMRLAIVADNLKDKEAVGAYILKVGRAMPAGPTQPEGLSAEHWDAYQILCGLKEPPPPPLPKDTAGLKQYVKQYPSVEAAWLALIDAQSKARLSEARDTLAEARKVHPGSEAILTESLRFALNRDRGRDADALAKELLQRNGDASPALEYLANEAVKAKKYELARDYYARVTRPELSETTGLKRKMEAALAKSEQEARDRARENAARDKKQADAAAERARAESRTKQAEADRKAALNPPAAKPKTVKPKTEKPKTTKNTSAKEQPAPRKPEPAAAAATPLEAAEAAVKARPTDLAAKYTLLDLYLDGKDLRKAKGLLKDIGTADNNSPAYAGAFAQYNYLKARYKDNVRNLGKMKNLDERARYYLGMSYFQLNDYEKAADVLRDLDRGRWPALRSVDRTLTQKTGKSQAASQNPPEAAKTAAATPPDTRSDIQETLRSGSLEARLGAFAHLLAQNDWRTARRHIKKAYDEAPRNRDVQYYRARLYLNDGDYERAANILYGLSSNGYREGEVYFFGGLAAYKNNDKPMATYLFHRAKIEGTTYIDDIDRILTAEKVARLTVTSRKVERKIKELEARSRLSDELAPRFALLRLYAVSGNSAKFEEQKNDLTSRRLPREFSDQLLAWNLFKFQHYDRALDVLEAYDFPEAVFLRGYIHLYTDGEERGRALLASLGDNASFPETADLLR